MAGFKDSQDWGVSFGLQVQILIANGSLSYSYDFLSSTWAGRSLDVLSSEWAATEWFRIYNTSKFVNYLTDLVSRFLVNLGCRRRVQQPIKRIQSTNYNSLASRKIYREIPKSRGKFFSPNVNNIQKMVLVTRSRYGQDGIIVHSGRSAALAC